MASVVRFVLLAAHTTMQFLWYSTFTRLDGIAVGILISLVLRGRVPSLSMRVRFLFVFLGLGGLMGASELLGSDLIAAPTLLGMLGFPLVGAACILLFLSVFGFPAERVRMVGWFRLVYLGKISYGLYVYHFLALLLARSAIGPLRMAIYPGLLPFFGVAVPKAQGTIHLCTFTSRLALQLGQDAWHPSVVPEEFRGIESTTTAVIDCRS
jgi:peptidoglycan/LPS O-acetylase OafA/YrhL